MTLAKAASKLGVHPLTLLGCERSYQTRNSST
ncbi:hypothetical protein GQ600_10230 [Phytophthora cactorum]|nr:hypothetical protein GQ600_10230 [Phytophthora cactorum]